LSLVHELWDGYVICPDYARAEKTGDKEKKCYIASPTGSQFTARLVQEFTSIHGPRKLIAFYAMCKRLGPWNETIEVNKKGLA